MEVSIPAQIVPIAAAFLAGLALGALYDVLSAIRRRGGVLTALLADLFFCVVFAAALFLLGMGPGGGTLRLYMPPLMLGGAALWRLIFGAAWRRCCDSALDAAKKGIARLAGPIGRGVCASSKKVAFFSKKWFTIIKEWTTIKFKYSRKQSRQKTSVEEPADETQTFRVFYQNCDPGTDRVRSRHD